MIPEQILCLQAATQIYRQAMEQTIALYLAGRIPNQTPKAERRAQARAAKQAQANRRPTF